LQLYEDQLAALDRRAREAERSRSAQIRLMIDASLGTPAEAAPAPGQEEARRA
jgi:hypothetical protein